MHGAHSWCSVNGGYDARTWDTTAWQPTVQLRSVRVEGHADMQGVSTEIPESPDALQSWENLASWGEEGPNSSLTPPCSPSCPLSSGILKAVPESRLAFWSPWNRSLWNTPGKEYSLPCKFMQSTLWKWFPGFLENLRWLPWLWAPPSCPAAQVTSGRSTHRPGH